MSTLGVTKLFGQKFVAESAEAKRIDQAQSNSVLAIISQELESALNQAFALAGKYVGIEPPTVTVDRDFDYYRLIGQDVAVLSALNENGKLSDEMLLEVLRRGEILPDSMDMEQELQRIQQLQAEKEASAVAQPQQDVVEENSVD